jgi:NAD(P)-dependent dehydrogenase (short-subunit alcohol dehydrogenase family)
MTISLLEGKVAMITGAASGIGAAACHVFATHGARLVLADINTDDGERAAKEITDNGGEALFVAADVTNSAAVHAMVDATLNRFGRLDCAFNNVGLDGEIGPLIDGAETNFDQVIAVNLKSVWLCLRQQIPAMLATGGGSIVNTSSTAGIIGAPYGLAPYTAAKHGVIGLTRAAALEYASSGIRVNVICPGVTRTPLYERAISSSILSEADIKALQPMGRLAEPSEIVATAAWLCSDAASFITGAVLAVDGGVTAGGGLRFQTS